jgi:hypothetical protein
LVFACGDDPSPLLKDRWNTRATLTAQPEAVEPVAWAVSRWNDEVSHRPLRNVNRRPLDDTWRQVIRHFGGDDEQLCGPRHDQLVEENPGVFIASPLAPDERMRRALEKIERMCRKLSMTHGERLQDIRTFVCEQLEALSRADEGKESEGGCGANRCRDLGCFGYCEPSDPTPQDTTAQREAIARIEGWIDFLETEAAHKLPLVAVEISGGGNLADDLRAILALQTRAGG